MARRLKGLALVATLGCVCLAAAIATAQRQTASPSKIAFVSSGSGSQQINLIQDDGSGLTSIGLSGGCVDWSPDGKQLVFSSSQDEIFIANADGTNPKSLKIAGHNPKWSPDGQRIAFASVQSSTSSSASGKLMTARTDGTDVKDLQVAAIDCDWSPDGARLIFCDSNGNLYLINADGTGVVNLGLSGQSPRWSNDGKRLAFAGAMVRARTSAQTLYVVNVDGTGLKDLGVAASSLDWSPDDSRIVFTHTTTSGLWTVGSDGSGAKSLGVTGFSPAWQPSPSTGPLITSVNPTTAPNTGPVTLTILGSGFQQNAQVSLILLGATPITGTNVAFVSANQITAQFDLTGKQTGKWNVKVCNPNGTCYEFGGAAGQSGFVITGPLPSVTSISPNNSCSSQVVTTTINGANFQQGVQAKLQLASTTNVATSVTFQSSTQLTAIFDLTNQTSGDWNVVLVNPDGGVTAAPFVTFRINPSPVVQSVSPTAAANTGPAQLTITGSGFLQGAQVALTLTNATPIVGSGVSVTGNGTQITATFDLTNKTKTLWTVAVQNPSGSCRLAELKDAFQVTAPVTAVAAIVSCIANDSSVSIVFNTPMNSVDAQSLANFALESPTGTAVNLTGATISYSSLALTTTISGLKLTLNNTFKVTATNIKDANGNLLPADGVHNVCSGKVQTPATLSLGAVPAPVAQGGSADISAVVTDGTGNRLGGVPLTFTAISGGGNFGGGQTSVTSTTDANGRATATLQAITFGDNQVRVSPDPKNPVAQAHPISPQVIDIIGQYTVDLLAGLNLVGVPLNLPQSLQDPASLFQTSAANLRLAGWDPTANAGAGDYVLYNGSNVKIVPGQGFWVQRFASVGVGISAGTPVPPSSEFSIHMNKGYQLIANPYPADRAWDLSDMHVRLNGADQGNLQQAGLNNKLVEPYTWIWNAATQAYELVFDSQFVSQVPGNLQSTMHTILPVGAGSWLMCNTNGVDFVFSAVTRSARDVSRKALPSRKADAQHWAFQLIASAGNLKDSSVLIGVMDSPITRGGLKVYKPPVAVRDGGYVEVSLQGNQGERYAWDLRSQVDSKTNWRFAVSTNLANADVHLTFPNLAGVPKNYRLYLVDEDTGKRQSLRTTAQFTIHTGNSSSTARNFRIDVTSAVGPRLRLTHFAASVAGRSAQAGVRLSYTLSQRASVTFRVRNTAGRVVYEFSPVDLQAGLNSAVWDGKGRNGAIVPRGVYLVELVARNDLGEQIQAVRTVQVR